MNKTIKTYGGYSGCDCLAVVNNKKVLGEIQSAKFDFVNKTITGVAAFFHQTDDSLIKTFEEMTSFRIALVNEYGNKMEYIATGITLEELEVEFSIDRIVFELEYKLKYDIFSVEEVPNKNYFNL